MEVSSVHKESKSKGGVPYRGPSPHVKLPLENLPLKHGRCGFGGSESFQTSLIASFSWTANSLLNYRPMVSSLGVGTHTRGHEMNLSGRESIIGVRNTKILNCYTKLDLVLSLFLPFSCEIRKLHLVLLLQPFTEYLLTWNCLQFVSLMCLYYIQARELQSVSVKCESSVIFEELLRLFNDTYLCSKRLVWPYGWNIFALLPNPTYF